MDPKIILDVLDRPNEPIFTPKGEQGVVFNVPNDYVEDRYKDSDVLNRFGSGGSDRVQVKPISVPNAIKIASQLPKDELFSLFIPFHRQLAGRLIEVFMGAQSTEDLVSMAVYCRGAGKINSALLNYAYSVALLNRADTKNVDLPPLSEFFPAKFVDGQSLRRAREEAKLSFDGGLEALPLELPLDFTASDLDPEHRVAYFREDIGINLHHWHWHLVYPFNGPQNVIAKDRRGELFYYMHQQIIARYNFERFSNRLPKVTRLLELRSPIPEGYFPKLDTISASRTWASRTPNTTLKDISRTVERLQYDILDLERWRDRLYEAVQTGRIIDTDGRNVALTETEGIDILGNLIEASDLSRNKNVYGDLHNLGHVAIAFSHDPDHRHLETFSVMGDSSTAMRDPVFYRWHAFVDDIFQNHKRTLRPYRASDENELAFNGVRVTDLEVRTDGAQQPNILNTFWQKSDAYLSRGMDFSPRSPIFARFTHLQHNPFEYRITINNTGKARQGTIRIFMAPRFDERGLPYLLNEQRTLMIELDKFVVPLNAGQNTITQKSSASSVTIPFERTFRPLETSATGTGLNEFNYCGCGWPQHMLIPKGTPEGLDTVLFVMVTNFETDKVNDPPRSNSQCKGAVSFCGVRDSKYPDRKPMGFPFDRQPIRADNTLIDSLDQFLTPNMKTQNVKIIFNNRVVERINQGGPVNRVQGGKPGNQNRPGNRPVSPNRPRN